jgi:hypothetical protein
VEFSELIRGDPAGSGSESELFLFFQSISVISVASVVKSGADVRGTRWLARMTFWGWCGGDSAPRTDGAISSRHLLSE